MPRIKSFSQKSWFSLMSGKFWRICDICVFPICAADYAKHSNDDRTVEDVFEYIEKNSEFIFVYHGSNIDLHRKVNLDIRDQSVEIILDKLFSGTDIEYIINNRQIIVRRDTKKRGFTDC